MPSGERDELRRLAAAFSASDDAGEAADLCTLQEGRPGTVSGSDELTENFQCEEGDLNPRKKAR
jgi:hypothetical protein